MLDPKIQTTLFWADLVSQNQISSQQQDPQQLEDNLPTKQGPLFSVDNLKSKQDIQLGLGLSKNQPTNQEPPFPSCKLVDNLANNQPTNQEPPMPSRKLVDNLGNKIKNNFNQTQLI